MEIGNQPQAVAPGVRTEQQSMLLTEIRHFQSKTKTTTNNDIRLQYVSTALHNELAEVGRTTVQFTDSYAQRRGTPQFGEATKIGMIQGLFQPVDIVLLQ